MSMPRIARLDAQVLGLCCQHNLSDVSKRHIMMMRARVVAPTNMHPHALCRDVSHGLVEDTHVGLGCSLEVLERAILELRVAAHGKIWAVHLQGEACGVDGVVLAFHGLAESLHILDVVLEVIISEEVGESARGGRREEDRLHRDLHRFCASLHALDLLLKISETRIRELDRPVARWVLHIRLFCQRQEALPALELVRVLRHLLEVCRSSGQRGGTEACKAVARGCDVVATTKLAIVDDIDARRALPSDDARRLVSKAGWEFRRRRHLAADHGQQI
mmetsp:Transcript_90666/g.194439  ORF Transcript_90666/g.194439 Transcript_90666/m.194439 type:complete len:276 (-) Transcript_90666:132-959(-)